MSKKLDYGRAQEILKGAFGLASGSGRLPVEWISYSRAVFELSAKTWTPAFATMLLAMATDSDLDAMSLKVESGNSGSYSARGLCHAVVVPSAVEYGFSIRNTGREPMNNQPFFRYSRIDGLERVRERRDRDFFVDVAVKVNSLGSDAAFGALAAFLRVALEVAERVREVKVRSIGFTPDGAHTASVDFLRRDAPDRPQRLQAFAAACLDLVFPDVRTRRIHDPSRDFPGDVQVFDHEAVTLAMEVRGKPVTQSDLVTFARSARASGVERAMIFVDAAHQEPLDVSGVARGIGGGYLRVATFMSVSELLGDVFLWSDVGDERVAEKFADAMLSRLKGIEVDPRSLEEWVRAVSVAQG